MTLAELNQLPVPALNETLTTCCGSSAWVDEMVRVFPVVTQKSLLAQAEAIWFALTESDWREAFAQHPKIGDLNGLREKFASTSTWAAGEQSGVSTASPVVLEELAGGNRLYEEKFGYIFIVCATGQSADQMLARLNARLPNLPDREIRIAMQEQASITRIRLEKLLNT